MVDYIDLYETRTMLMDLLYEAANFSAYEGKISRKEFDKIINLDPTPVKTYAKWLLARYIALGGDPELQARFFEDGFRFTRALEIFEKLKKKKLAGINIDIMTYKSLQSLEDVTDQYLDKPEELEVAPKVEKDVIRVYDDPNWAVVIPKTYEASCTYGAQTRWCTASRTSDYHYNNYSARGPLVIVIHKTAKPGENAKWQFHLASNSYMNAADSSVGSEGVVSVLSMLPPAAQAKLSALGYNKETFELSSIFSYSYRGVVDSERVKQLIAAGANPHIQNEAVLKWAVQTNESILVDYLIKDKTTDRSVLADMVTEAARVGNLEFMKKIVAEVGPESLNANGGKTLIAACSTSLDLVQYVVENGGDVNVARGEPLATACANGKIAIARYLLESGADPNANNSVAYWRAYKNKRPKTLALLLSFGAKPA